MEYLEDKRKLKKKYKNESITAFKGNKNIQETIGTH